VALNQRTESACHSQGVGAAPPLSASELAQAVLANDCAGELRSQDNAWVGTSCEEDNPEPGNGNGGCSASPEAASIGILLALVTALARRR
jgi:hypothetical protein